MKCCESTLFHRATYSDVAPIFFHVFLEKNKMKSKEETVLKQKCHEEETNLPPRLF